MIKKGISVKSEEIYQKTVMFLIDFFLVLMEKILYNDFGKSQ